jgi:hypothetical protein
MHVVIPSIRSKRRARLGLLERAGWWRILALAFCALALAPSRRSYAQEPRPAGNGEFIEGTVGNEVMQLRYLTPSPLSDIRGDLDYGLLLSERRDVIASAALMFDTNLKVLPGMRFQIGPQAYLADLAAAQKTDVLALSLGANTRYEIIPRLGVAAFGSAFYSPGVITFGSAHNLYDFTAGAEIRLAPRLTALGGYRWLKFTTVNEPDVRVQNEVFAGLRWRRE